MHKASNMQFKDALDSFNGKYNSQLFDLAARHTEGVTSTQIVEDVIGAQKNNASVRSAKRFRRPELSMFKALQGHVLDKRHGYEVANMDIPLQASNVVLTKENFVPCPTSATVKFTELATYTQQASFFRPRRKTMVVSLLIFSC